MPSRRDAFLGGVKAVLPILLGVSPFGLMYGVLALSAGLPAMLVLAMSSIVFAGSAQFVGAQLLGVGAPAIVILSTTFIVNLRHILYGASIAPHFAHLSLKWKCALAYLLTDEAYAVSITRFVERTAISVDSPHKHWYFLGAGLAQWSAWQASTLAGIVLGARIPAGWGLEFTVALTFIALVVPTVIDRASTAAALSAGIVATLALGLPYKLGIIVAAITGVIAGLVVEGWRTQERDQR
jgi:4-azaleucine resistance transporter AzlC